MAGKKIYTKEQERRIDFRFDLLKLFTDRKINEDAFNKCLKVYDEHYDVVLKEVKEV